MRPDVRHRLGGRSRRTAKRYTNRNTPLHKRPGRRQVSVSIIHAHSFALFERVKTVAVAAATEVNELLAVVVVGVVEVFHPERQTVLAITSVGRQVTVACADTKNTYTHTFR